MNHADPLAKTVMVVDDEVFFRNMLREILEDSGFRVVAEAKNGLEAVANYARVKPDVVILDIYMPEKGGFDSAREILSVDKNARIVICSGSGYDEDAQYAMTIGVKGVILKPFIPKEVVETVRKAAA